MVKEEATTLWIKLKDDPSLEWGPIHTITLLDSYSDSDSDSYSHSKPYGYIVLCKSFNIGLYLDTYSDGVSRMVTVPI